MSAQHTPGPWTARQQIAISGESLGWIIEHANGRIGWSSYATATPNEGERAPHPIGAANALHIVKCVNAHDKLVEALNGLLAALDGVHIHHAPSESEPIEHYCGDDIAKARAAIAAANGQKGE